MSKIAFVFPGQGAQSKGMGRELADGVETSRRVFEAADRALEASISRICFEGSETELALTENTQPAVLTVSVAAVQALLERGVDAQGVAGHSLGEYSAHVCAGTFSFEDAVRAVRDRGRFMQESVPVGQGAMAAILGLDLAAVESVCDEITNGRLVSPANLNAPGQIVVAGHADAVDRAVEACRRAGAIKAVPLAVSAPFHCALMEPAERRLEPVLGAMDFSDPRIPVYTNADARPVFDAESARSALLRQVSAPVRWHELVEAMLEDGFDTFVEVGPGKVLSGLIRRVRRSVRVFQAGTPEAIDRVVEELGGRG